MNSTNVPCMKGECLEILGLKSEISGGFIMKKFSIFVLVLVLVMSVLTGCRRVDDGMSTDPSITTVPTSQPTVPPVTNPPASSTPDSGMVDILPGTEDTINPSNGANENKF